MEKKVKIKLNKKGLIVILLILYLLIMVFYYGFNLPVKLIVVSGNTNISDEQIIKASKLNKDSKLFRINKKRISKYICEIPEIESVKIKKNILGKVVIYVNELSILYYKETTSMYILENGEPINIEQVLGIPTLVNDVPKDNEEILVKKMSTINKDKLKRISEIEYSPDIKDNTIIDKNRFLLRMNDGNYVYINLANMTNLNKYDEIYITLDEFVKGVLNLDSSSENGVVFQTFDYLEKKEVQNELSEDS